MKKIIQILILILYIPSVFGQEKTITGVVSDVQNVLPYVNVYVKNTTKGTTTDNNGKYTIKAKKGDILVFTYIGYTTEERKVGTSSIIYVTMKPAPAQLDEIVVVEEDEIIEVQEYIAVPEPIAIESPKKLEVAPAKDYVSRKRKVLSNQNYRALQQNKSILIIDEEENDDAYATIKENEFKSVQLSPLSTFSIDVDKASYSNIRRMINSGEKIPKDAVKIEEMVNYFDYKYPQPKGVHPFSITTEVTKTPWNAQSKLVRIGVQGKKYAQENLPASNLTFLIDVSGSMRASNKLPLLKKAFKLLVNQLRKKDNVAIVVYAGAAGVVLKPTSGDKKEVILKALDALSAGGSTAGGEGIELAYKLAEKNFKRKGNNRVILATDGDFNVGASSDKAMEKLIEEKRKTGVFLSVLGFGIGNYKDSKLETLADKGNGNHAYVDTMQEAQKVFGKEFGGTLHTIAKDVKIQVEFNPKKVQAYRLIGYENRMLNDKDFIDDTKDAGELGSNHNVTALYEVIPVGVKSEYLNTIPDLKYTKTVVNDYKDELLLIKFRYKKPREEKSIEIVKVVKDALTNATADMNFASAVALFGMHLRDSKYTNSSKMEDIISLAKKGKGTDEEGYRGEFVRLVKAHMHIN